MHRQGRGRPRHQGRRDLLGQVELHGRRRHQGHGRRLRPRRDAARGLAVQLLAAEAVPPHGDLRQAARGRDQRRGARRRPRGHARLPLPRDRGRPEGGRRPARGDHRPAARCRRHPARAAADRHPRGAAPDHRGQAALAGGRAQEGAGARGRTRGRDRRARPAVDFERRRGRPALGQEGLQDPRRRGPDLAGRGAGLHGRHRAHRARHHAQLPGAARHPLVRVRRHAGADRPGPRHRVEVLRQAARRAGGAQPHAQRCS